MKKYYTPFLSDRTKNIINERNCLKEEATKNGDSKAEKEVKKLGKEIKKAVVKDEKEYYEKDFGENADSSTAWRTG